MGAGLPSWKALLEKLVGRAGYPPEAVESLQQLGWLDQAQVLAIRMGTSALKQAVAELVKARHYSLAHGLLAGLQTRESVTQNYDELFEQAWDANRQELSVLRYRPRPGRPWLLKMHGCRSQPEDIVLTRQDYQRYSNWGAALAGVVQALLLTRHMLFVGFSLSDENFLSSVDAVRRAARGLEPSQGPLGTALLLDASLPVRELWSDVDLMPLGDGRRLEIFLDRVLAFSQDSSSHLLDETFDSLLTDPERRLKHELLQLEERIPEELRELSAWQLVEKTLRGLKGGE